MNIAKDVVSSIKDASKSKTSAYDTQATVTRIEGDTAWVHIPGGVNETPVQLTVNASEGDAVQVRVANGTAWITGNASAPPTDDKKANIAYTLASTADEEAQTAHSAAQSAVADAGVARQAAESAQADATRAQASADNAGEYAARALGNLASVQSVAETLAWITAHGTMTLTTDTALDPSHVYFVRDNNGDYTVGSYRYSVVSEPVLADISTYYELSIDESLNNYVATHLVVDTEGLWIIPDAGGNKVLIATGQGTGYPSAGTYIVNGSAVLASFTATGAQIGQTGESHLEMDYHSMKLVDKEGNEYFYVSDLRDKNDGYQAIIRERYIGDGEQQSFPVSLPVSDEVSATDSSHSWNPASRNDQLYTFAQAPSNGATVIITYKTTSVYAKSWILGLGYLSESGPLSVSEGTGIARGYCSHSEGSGLTEGVHSHAEGATTKALGDCSHAEGNGCTAEALAAHAEGWGTRANGRYSHAQNINTEANYEAQTVIGKYNDNKSDTAFEIGNGKLNSGTEDRSNSHEFTWDGNIRLALDTTATSGTDFEIYDALQTLGWDSDVIV